jgi:hypothetical protein
MVRFTIGQYVGNVRVRWSCSAFIGVERNLPRVDTRAARSADIPALLRSGARGCDSCKPVATSRPEKTKPAS